MNKPKICCVTGNKGKWLIVEHVLGDMFELVQEPLDTPEIQSMDVEDVALFSARWAARELRAPVFKIDVGYEVAALNGFPGPFVKWINQMLTAENILAMMAGRSDRSIRILSALAYAEPDGFCRVKTHVRHGVILEDVSACETPWRSVFDRIVLEDGMTQRFADIPFDRQIAFLIESCREEYRAFGTEISARLRR